MHKNCSDDMWTCPAATHMDDPGLTHAPNTHTPILRKQMGSWSKRWETGGVYFDTWWCFFCVNNWTEQKVSSWMDQFVTTAAFLCLYFTVIRENDIAKEEWEWTRNGHLSINNNNKKDTLFWRFLTAGDGRLEITQMFNAKQKPFCKENMKDSSKANSPVKHMFELQGRRPPNPDLGCCKSRMVF